MLIRSVIAVGAFLSLSIPATAGLMLISHQFDGNDCAGYFNGYSNDANGFEACQIWVNDSGEKIQISPVIAKYDFDKAGNLSSSESNSAFPSFDLDSITVSGSDQTSGSWTYNQGETDPGIRYWSAKGGDFFNLFWYIDESDSSVCEASAYTLDCLNLAKVVTSGEWSTPINDKNDKGFGLSHIVFYDSDPAFKVPEPGTALLLATGIFGLVASRKRMKKAA